MIEPRRDARPELRGRHDRLPQLHRGVARGVLERVTDLVGDDRGGGDRQPRGAWSSRRPSSSAEASATWVLTRSTLPRGS